MSRFASMKRRCLSSRRRRGRTTALRFRRAPTRARMSCNIRNRCAKGAPPPPPTPTATSRTPPRAASFIICNWARSASARRPKNCAGKSPSAVFKPKSARRRSLRAKNCFASGSAPTKKSADAEEQRALLAQDGHQASLLQLAAGDN